MNGYEALERLADMPETRHIPVIALTAAATEADIKRRQTAGFFAYLTKPVQARLLLETIDAALSPTTFVQSEEHISGEEDRILIIDDLDVNLVIARKQCAKLGVVCDTESDPVRGLERLKSGRYALALVDISMPGMSGIELTERLRTSERGGDRYTPILALTASYGSAEDMRRFRDVGMDGQLTKPISLEDLAKELRRWLATDAPNENSSAEEVADNIEAPIDLAFLAEILGTNEKSEFVELLDMFVDYFPNALESLENAINSRDREEIQQAAHAAKSASLNAAAKRLSERLHSIEIEAETVDWEWLNEGLQDIRMEFERISAFCKTYVKEQ